MNKSNNKPRNVQTASSQRVEQQIKNLKNEMNPIPQAKKTSATPKPMRQSASVYVTRKVRMVKSVPTSSASITFTVGDVCVALGLPTTTTVTFLTDRMSVWNTTNSMGSSNYVSLLPSNALFAPISGAISVPYEDYGSGGISPALTVDFPRSLSTTISATTGSLSPFAVIQAAPGSITNSVAQTIVLDAIVSVEY